MANNLLGLCIWLCVYTIFPVDSVQIHFYENQDFTGLYLESNSSLKCNNFPENKSPFIKSIQTDTCLMIYLDINCKSPYSWKIMPPEISDGEYRLGSFHICNEKEGGTQLNLDITEFYDIWNPTQSPKILESYQNICSCVNVPKYIQLLDEWSVNNHGNDIFGYYEPNCSDRKWEPKLLPAGHSFDSRKVYMHQMTDGRTNKGYGIQSFGPVKYSTYFKASCGSAGAHTQITADKVEVQRNHFGRDSKIDGNGLVEYCKIDNNLLKIVQDGFAQQMKAYSDLLKQIGELEQKIEKICEK